MKKIIFLLASAIVFGDAVARDQIRIVGSSTVYPFARYVAEEFGSVTRYPTPVVESTGTGGGMKLFCSDNSLKSPDIANASRRMKLKELNLCDRNGVDDITEVMFGYDGIVVAQSLKNKHFDISKKELLLAVIKRVPNENNVGLIENPYRYWDEINPELSHRKIVVYGPPVSSGTRDAFAEMVLQYQTEEMKVYRDAGLKGYRVIRTDGVYIPSSENGNLIVKKLTEDVAALGIFDYRFLSENKDVIVGVDIDGIPPMAENISTKRYPISRSLFFYIKNDHTKGVPAMKEYIRMFLDSDLVGEEGVLSEMGLIPLSEQLIKENLNKVVNLQKLTPNDLKRTH